MFISFSYKLRMFKFPRITASYRYILFKEPYILTEKIILMKINSIIVRSYKHSWSRSYE